MNDKNLIPLNQRSLEERREIARKGGIKSGEKRRERKAFIEKIKQQWQFYDLCEEVVISHAMKKRYCNSCKYKQRANKERTGRKRNF